MPLRRQPGERARGARRGRWLASRLGERGAALVEAAIVLPVVITMLFGVLEYGFVFKDELTISNAVRAGARIGAADGKQMSPNSSDYDIVQAVKSASSALGSTAIQKVIVFKASASISQVSQTTCNQSTGTFGVCNVYPGSLVNAGTLDSTKFGCSFGDYDIYWCPSSRSDSQTAPDYVGVYIEITHNYVTKMFGNSRTMKDQAVFRVEPNS